MYLATDVLQVLDKYRGMVNDELEKLFVPPQSATSSVSSLYKAALDYPLRGGKALRPALCLASCSAVGGADRDALKSAVAIELFHNGFLIKDDIMDHSVSRRGSPTLHRKYWPELALDAGDMLNVISMKPLVDNLAVIGAYRSLLVFMEIQKMALEAVEGQAMELTWTRSNEWNLHYNDYYEMCQKKTGWYTCAAPCRIGAIIGSKHIDPKHMASLTRFALNLGIAFQIEDDLLNLSGDRAKYGKEIDGDLWEGKRTIMLIHLLRNASRDERRSILNILQKPRSSKKAAEVSYIHRSLEQYGSLRAGNRIKMQFARRAQDILANECDWMPNQRMKAVLGDIAQYAVNREQ